MTIPSELRPYVRRLAGELALLLLGVAAGYALTWVFEGFVRPHL